MGNVYDISCINHNIIDNNSVSDSSYDNDLNIGEEPFTESDITITIDAVYADDDDDIIEDDVPIIYATEVSDLSQNYQPTYILDISSENNISDISVNSGTIYEAIFIEDLPTIVDGYRVFNDENFQHQSQMVNNSFNNSFTLCFIVSVICVYYAVSSTS